MDTEVGSSIDYSTVFSKCMTKSCKLCIIFDNIKIAHFVNTFVKYFEVVHVKCTDHVRTTASHKFECQLCTPCTRQDFLTQY